ncbi:MAG: hypothetical protein NTW96_11540 [Planctomycetia bacterium]|nr:hypothetical protein [Planctomycetia bacterium]
MFRTMVVILGVVVVGVGVAITQAARDNDKDDKEQGEKQVSLDQIPEAAKAALVKLAGKAKIEEVGVEEEDGVTLYEGSWKVKNAEHEAMVTADGDLVERTSEVALGKTPKAVQDAAAKAFAEGAKLTVERKTIVLYEIEATVDGKEKEILVAPTGQRVEIDDEDQDNGGDQADEDHEDADDK